MAAKNSEFERFLAQEAEKVKGTAVPVKAGFLRRIFTHRIPVRRLHPNPEDEFCSPSVGPNYQIISGYEEKLRLRQKYSPTMRPIEYSEQEEPLSVERIRPDGYMILNGHHRWAAAIRAGVSRLPVRIVNLTQLQDIEKMIRASRNDRRVAMDLDEVIFADSEGGLAEKPLPFPGNLFHRQPMRLGVPALCRFLQKQGYDLWVYTTGYRSLENVKLYLRVHHILPVGIVTGYSRKTAPGDREKIEEKIHRRYLSTVHIDRETVVKIDNRARSFEEIRLSGEPASWSREIMEILESPPANS